MNASNGTNPANQLLSVSLEEHQIGCQLCQANLGRKPIPNLGGGPTVCSERIRIIAEWADKEGRVNNIVARTEYGHEAPRGL